MLKHAKHVYPYNTPQTKEAYYYRMLFEKHFPQVSPADYLSTLCSFLQAFSPIPQSSINTKENILSTKCSHGLITNQISQLLSVCSNPLA